MKTKLQRLPERTAKTGQSQADSVVARRKSGTGTTAR